MVGGVWQPPGCGLDMHSLCLLEAGMLICAGQGAPCTDWGTRAGLASAQLRLCKACRRGTRRVLLLESAGLGSGAPLLWRPHQADYMPSRANAFSSMHWWDGGQVWRALDCRCLPAGEGRCCRGSVRQSGASGGPAGAHGGARSAGWRVSGDALGAKVREATAPAAATRDRHAEAAEALRHEVEALRWVWMS